MMIDLTEKVAVVTGGAGGIGRGICKALAGQGADIVVADMNVQGAKSTADAIAATGRRASVVDVTSRSETLPRISSERPCPNLAGSISWSTTPA